MNPGPKGPRTFVVGDVLFQWTVLSRRAASAKLRCSCGHARHFSRGSLRDARQRGYLACPVCRLGSEQGPPLGRRFRWKQDDQPVAGWTLVEQTRSHVLLRHVACGCTRSISRTYLHTAVHKQNTFRCPSCAPQTTTARMRRAVEALGGIEAVEAMVASKRDAQMRGAA